MKLSIIIPVLNEAKTIGKLLSYLISNSSSKNIQEILIVDGGSTDGTQEIINSFVVTSSDPEDVSGLYREVDKKKGLDTFTSDTYQKVKTRPDILLLHSPKGRAKQMNLGAKESKGEILYFLHADSYPPKDFDEFILNEVKKGFRAGCFRMKFDSNHPVLKFSQWFTRFNLKSCRGGDQSLFIEKNLFNVLDGFKENYIIYEDCEFINRIYDTTKFRVIPKTLTTSARRYQTNGTWKLQYHFAVIHLKKWLGASPEKLSAYYFKNIVS